VYESGTGVADGWPVIGAVDLEGTTVDESFVARCAVAAVAGGVIDGTGSDGDATAEAVFSGNAATSGVIMGVSVEAIVATSVRVGT